MACCSSSAPATCLTSEREQLAKDLKAKGMADAIIATQLANPDKYTFFVPQDAHWSTIRHLKTNVGTALNKALEALEDDNVEALQDVLKGTINFNRKIGQHTLDDDTLVNFIQNFDKIPLKDSDFEFPDLLGAAYEWLIKHFADSAGKKAGEFYTPAEVVRICVEICVHQNHVFRVRCNAAVLLSNYLAYFSESEFGKKYFVMSSRQSTNLASINSTRLKAYPIALPKLEEQSAIIQSVQRAKNSLVTLNKEANSLLAQKLGLLQDLLIGKVDVTIKRKAV